VWPNRVIAFPASSRFFSTSLSASSASAAPNRPVKRRDPAIGDSACGIIVSARGPELRDPV
jgi:hypothetical protein